MDYKSQIGQDKYFIENINNSRTGLYFVDIGANDGISFSNTYCLEKYLNWNGLCVEANDEIFNILINNRNCVCLNECIYNESGIEVELEIPLANEIPEGNNMLSRIKNDNIKNSHFDRQFEQTKTIKKVTKTLTEIFEQNNVPNIINYMSIDIEGYDLFALKGLDFDKYSIEFLTIEHGGSTQFFNEIKEFLSQKGYILHRINKWDAEFTKDKTINSFDVFDTILCRTVVNPTDIFSIVENTFPFPNFYNMRCQAQCHSNGTFDSIYEKFGELYNIDKDTCKLLKEFEIQTEISNSYLLVTNYNRVKNGDILVSDMYLSENDIMRILRAHGFSKNVKLFASPAGKSNGYIWPQLKSLYSIGIHLGDNNHSDVISPSMHNIKGELTTIYKINETERFFIDNGYKEFAFLIRKFRHMNPYIIGSHEYQLYNDQICYNIPALYMMSHILNDMMITEGRDTLLLLTRDGCLMKHIFPTLYPTYKCSELQSSRKIHRNPTPEYKEYIKSMYDPDKAILFDIYGSFSSGRKLYLELFGKYPRVHVLGYHYIESSFEGLTWTVKGISLEGYNIDTTGSLFGMNGTNFMRYPLLEYSVKDAQIYKDTVIAFCDFINDKHIYKITILDKFLNTVKYINHKKINPYNINNNIWQHPSLTDIANNINCDKGSKAGCGHTYTDYYELLLQKFINNKKVNLLEFGAGRYIDLPSLTLWRKYFSNNLLNIDIFDKHTKYLKYTDTSNNVYVYIGDQTSGDCINTCTGNKHYDIVIDDGPHCSKSQQIALKSVWSHLNHGGIYCIESLHWQPLNSIGYTTQNLLRDWKDNVVTTTEYINTEEANIIVSTIDKIEFYPSKSRKYSEEIVKNAFCVLYKK